MNGGDPNVDTRSRPTPSSNERCITKPTSGTTRRRAPASNASTSTSSPIPALSGRRRQKDTRASGLAALFRPSPSAHLRRYPIVARTDGGETCQMHRSRRACGRPLTKSCLKGSLCTTFPSQASGSELRLHANSSVPCDPVRSVFDFTSAARRAGAESRPFRSSPAHILRASNATAGGAAASLSRLGRVGVRQVAGVYRSSITSTSSLEWMSMCSRRSSACTSFRRVTVSLRTITRSRNTIRFVTTSSSS
jgi:hypothetical protein